jgi:hypothetical protein
MMATANRLDASSIAYWRQRPDEFIETVLINPEDGAPFELLPAEREFLKHAFTLGPDGRLLYPTQIYSAIKKSGKSTFGSILVLVFILLFGGRFAEGYCLANDEEQARGRVFEGIRRVVQASPILAREADIVQNKVTFPATGAIITAVASDYTSAAGCNPTISVFDELWGYQSERAWRLWDEFVPSPARTISARLVVTHAGFSGESELLEKLYERGIALPLVGPDLHAGPGLLCFWSHTPIAPWQTPEWIEEKRADPSFRPHQFLRMIENRFVTNEESFIDMSAWDACAIARPVVADPGMPVWVAVDASVKRDSTGISVMTWDTGVKKPRHVWHKIFKPTPKDPLDFEGTIEETLLGLKSRFRVCRVFYDPYQMAAVAQRMQRAGLPMTEFPQTMGNITRASQNLYELIQGQNLIAYPDDEIRLALSRAVAVENARGWKIAKEKTSHKVDVVVAMAMAALGAVEKGGLGQVRVGFTSADGAGPITWLNDTAPMPPLRFADIDELGNELSPEQARAIRNGPLPGRKGP